MLSILDQWLWLAVKKAVDDAEFGIAPGCESALRTFIDKGVQGFSPEQFSLAEKLLGDGIGELTSTLPDKELMVARGNLLRFVDYMIEVAKNEDLSELQEFTFTQALSKLCPLWPFC